jgi:hypothetical protein
MQIDWAGIEKKNQANLKKLKDGQSIDFLYVLAGRNGVVLIGPGHSASIVTEVKKNRPYQGTITITKGGLTNAGELKVTGVKSDQLQFKDALKNFTKKKIVFA